MKIVKLYLFICTVLSLSIHSQGYAQQPLFSFGVIADVQYCDCDHAGTRHYRSSVRKLQAAVDTLNKKDIAFVVSLGDYIDRNFGSFDTLNQIVSRLKVPLYHVIGNHDYSVDAVHQDEVPQILGLKERYYDFEKGGWRFIALDGNFVSIHGTQKSDKRHETAIAMLQALKDQEAPNAYDWNGAVGTHQLQWLEKKLAQAKKKNEKVILLCHFPVTPEDGAETLWDAGQVKNLLKNKDHVFAYFNGHAHQERYLYDDGVHYMTFAGMVEEETNAFAIVHVYEGHLDIQGYDRVSHRHLE